MMLAALYSALLGAAVADFVLFQNFGGNGCSGNRFTVQAQFPQGCIGLGKASQAVTCVNETAAVLSSFSSPDCSGKATPTGPLSFPAGCHDADTGVGSTLVTCVEGLFAPPAGGVLTQYFNNQCPPSGLKDAVEVQPLGICMPFNVTDGVMFTCSATTLTATLYPAGCPNGRGEIISEQPLGCSRSSDPKGYASDIECTE